MTSTANTNDSESTNTVEYNNECSICYQNPHMKHVITPCNHFFCTQCFFKWMKEVGTCPICRRELTQNGEALEDERRRRLEEIQNSINRELALLNLMRKENEELQKNNNKLIEKKNNLHYLILDKLKEIDDLEKERLAIRNSIKSKIKFRNRWEELNGKYDFDIDLAELLAREEEKTNASISGRGRRTRIRNRRRNRITVVNPITDMENEVLDDFSD